MILNETIPKREKYQEFYGSNTEQMQLLINDKRVPMTVKQIIERRLNSRQDDWRNNYFDTCDAIVYGAKGKFKIVKNSKVLRSLALQTKLRNGNIPITQKQYERIRSKEFDRNAPKESIWQYMLEDLYEPYIQLLGYCPSVWLSDIRTFSLGAAYVCRLEGGSRVGGGVGLDDDNGRLVGVAAELLEAEN